MPKKFDPAEPASPMRALRRHWAAAAFAVAFLAIAALPLAGAAPSQAASGPLTGPTSASTGVWAWGAFSNSTYSSDYVGAYLDALNLTNGNLSHASAFVAEAARLHAQTGAFTVVNATAPTAKNRSIVATSIAVANYTGLIEVVGDLPAPGTYAPSTPVRLVNTTEIYYAHILAATVYEVYANYTLSNGTLAIANEHALAWSGINTTTIAYHWPHYVANPNGTTTVSYSTSAYVALGWVAEVVKTTFHPALPLSEAPLSVGKSWNATTNASVVGWAAYATASAWTQGATNASSSSSGVTSLNTTASLSFGFKVVGSESVIFPNGTEETGYEIASTANGASAGAYLLWDGLVVLPTAAPAPPSALHPATAFGTQAAVAPTAGPATIAIVTATGFPVATTTQGTSSTTVATAPMTPDRAQSQIRATETPTKPTTPGLPSTSNPPTTNPPATNPPPGNGTPTNPGPTGGAPTQPLPKKGAGTSMPVLSVAVLAALVAGIAAAFLGIALVRERRKP